MPVSSTKNSGTFFSYVGKTSWSKESISKPVSLSTMITDGSNPRYNVFDSLVLKDKDTKILSFAKEG